MQKSSRIYWGKKFIGSKNAIDRKAEKVIITYKSQFDQTIRKIINQYPHCCILSPTISTDQVVYERTSQYPHTDINGVRYYYFDTTKSHICITNNYNRIIKAIPKDGFLVYGGLQPCIRFEIKREEGWRERVFPQGDFEIISFVKDQKWQNQLESEVLIALVKCLNLHGFSHEQIIIRINNKESIFHKLWRNAGLTDVNNDKFLKNLNDLEKDFLNEININKWKHKEIVIWNKIKGLFSTNEAEFIYKILTEGTYDTSLIIDKYPEIVNEINRMSDIISVVKKALNQDINIYVDPRSIKPGSYRGITIQADIKINGKYYAEVCGGGCDFSFFPGYYIGGFALGLMRLNTLQKLIKHY